MTVSAQRVLFKIEVKDCVLPKAPAVLTNAALSICFEQGHRIASTSDRTLLAKAGEDPRVSSFPRESLALVLVMQRDVRINKYMESFAQIVVRMRKEGSLGGEPLSAEAHYKGLAIAQLKLHEILASTDLTGGVSGEIRLPLSQFPWTLSPAEEKNASIIVTVTAKVIGAVTPDGSGAEVTAALPEHCSSADFGHDSEDERLNPASATPPSPNRTNSLESVGGGKSRSNSVRSLGSSSVSAAGGASASRLKSSSGSNPYAAAINAAVAASAASKKKCDAMSAELRLLNREHEESSKLRQALKALQAKFDSASRDLAEQTDVVSTQARVLQSKVSPELANLSGQLAARDATISSLKVELEAARRGAPPPVDAAVKTSNARAKDLELQLAAATTERDKLSREKDRAAQELEETKRVADDLSKSLLRLRHEGVGQPTKGQVNAIRSDLEMTKSQLKASLDLIDALSQLPSPSPARSSSPARAEGKESPKRGVKKTSKSISEADLKAILSAASARGKEFSDVCTEREELKAQVDTLSRQLMVLRRAGSSSAATFGSVIGAAKAAPSLDGWSEAQFSSWEDEQALTAVEVETASIFTADEARSSGSALGECSDEVAALESKLQTSSAQLRLKESQLASAKSALEASKHQQEKLKAEMAALTEKIQSGVSFMTSIENKVAERDAQILAAHTLADSLQEQLFAALREGEALRASGVSVKAAPVLSSPARTPTSASGTVSAAVVAEYEEKLQEAANYVAYQDTELARERENVLSLENRVRDLDREKRELQAQADAAPAPSLNQNLGRSPSDGSTESLLREAQDRARLLKRENERQKLEIQELQDLVEVRDEHIQVQQRRLKAFEAGRAPSPATTASADKDSQPSAELKSEAAGKKQGKKSEETKALNRRVSELEDQLNATMLKNKAQEDKLTKAAEYIKYQKEQLTAYMGEVSALREALEQLAAAPQGPTANELALSAELDEVRRFAEEFEAKLIEAAEYIDQQAAEVSSVQSALDRERRDRLAAISTKSTVVDLPKQPALPFLNSRNDPENIDFDECMEYLRRIDQEVTRARKQELTYAQESINLQASLKQAMAAAAAIQPVYHAPPPPASLKTVGAVSPQAEAQIKEARDVAKRLAQEKNQLEATVTQLMEQLGRGDGGSKKNPVGSPAAAKYDDFEKIVNDLISLKMELSSVRDELDESRRKNDEAADSLRTISQLQDELSRVKTAKTMLEKQMAEDAARNPFDLDDNGTTGRSSLNSSNRGPLAGDDPLVTEAREIAKKYYSEMQAAKMQVSSLTAELSAAKIVVKAAPRGGAAPGQGPLSDAERDALVQSLIDTKMQIDSLTAELEDERRRSSELVLRLNDSTTKIASLEARLSNSAGSAIAKPKGIARWGVSSSNSSSSSSSR